MTTIFFTSMQSLKPRKVKTENIITTAGTVKINFCFFCWSTNVWRDPMPDMEGSAIEREDPCMNTKCILSF